MLCGCMPESNQLPRRATHFRLAHASLRVSHARRSVSFPLSYFTNGNRSTIELTQPIVQSLRNAASIAASNSPGNSRNAVSFATRSNSKMRL